MRLKKNLEISDFTAIYLQDDKRGPILVEEYREQVPRRLEDSWYLAGYNRSVFKDFESYLRTEVDLVEDDIRLVLDKYNSSYITYTL